MSVERVTDPYARVNDLAREHWQASGLTDEQAKTLKFRILTPEDTAKLGKSFHPVGALLIPYFDLDGEETSFYRVRYLEPLPGFAGAVEKPQRYAQAPGTLNEAYFPPLLDRAWRKIADDPNETLLITEGEKKAAVTSATGLPCLALGGVDVWRSTKKGVDFLPALAEIKWKGRPVVVVFDSDAATNPNVVRAQITLARELNNRGALVKIASLPPGPKGAKQGLDDFLVAGGALNDVIEKAEDFLEGKALWELNDEIVYINDPGVVVVQATGQRITAGSFVQHNYANRFYRSMELNKLGQQVLKKKPIAPRWISWEERFALQKMTYLPGKPKIHEDQWNTWPGWGVKPKKGDMAPWHWLLGFLFRDQPESKKWFEQWLAYPLQHPGTKLYTSAVLWGTEKGTGKTLIAYSMMRIYGKNSIEIKNKDLRGNFNGWAESKQFVYGDEITGGDKRVDADWLKGLITQHTMRINAKYLPEFELPDCISYLFSSNHPDAFFLEDGDRRFFVHEVVGDPAEQRFYEICDKWLHGDGPAALFDHLLHVDLTGFNPRERAPMTPAKEAMISDGRSDLATWVAELKADPERILMPIGKTAAARCDLYTSGQLLWCYERSREDSKVTSTGMGRALKSAGLRTINGGAVIKTKTFGVQRLYAIRNQKDWYDAEPLLAAEHFDAFFGTDSKHTKF